MLSIPTSSQLMALLRQRRSVKPSQFGEGEVPDALIEEMLEAARWAPTHAVTQPWRIAVYTGKGIAAFTAYRQQLYRQLHSAETFNQVFHDKLESGTHGCTHILLMGMQRQATRKLPEWEEVAAVASAAQNMQLVAVAGGAACYWSTGGLSTHAGLLPLLELGEGDQMLGMIMVGAAGETPEAPARREVESFARWVRE